MAIRLVFETHSISRDNEAGLATGWLDSALSEAGRRLAPAIGERHPDADLVVASDLGRARETADLAFAGRAVPVRLDPRQRECNYGDGNGMPVARAWSPSGAGGSICRSRAARAIARSSIGSRRSSRSWPDARTAPSSS